MIVLDYGGYRSLLQRRFHEVMPVEALSLDGEEECPGGNGSGVNGISSCELLAERG